MVHGYNHGSANRCQGYEPPPSYGYSALSRQMTPWCLELFVNLTLHVGLVASTSETASPTVSHRILGTSERQFPMSDRASPAAQALGVQRFKSLGCSFRKKPSTRASFSTKPQARPSRELSTSTTMIGFLLLVPVALGFAPVTAPVGRTSAVKAVDEFVIGVQPPAGFFDPLNYCETQPESFARRRAVERKHGRVAMMAMVRLLVNAFFFFENF